MPRSATMPRFLRFLFVVTTLAHAPVALAFFGALVALGAPYPAPLAVLAAAGLSLAFLGRARALMPDRRRSRWVVLLVDEPYFIHWSAAILASVPIAAGALFVWASQLAIGAPLTLPTRLALGAYLVAAALAAWGVVVRRRWTRLRTLDVPVAGLDEAFDGYRIAQLSDLHIGSYVSRRWAERWVRTVNRLDVDLVALTGDYVTSGVEFYADIAATVAGFRARDGVVAVMGNHDYFGDGEPLVEQLRATGAKVLRNEHTTIERAGAGITVAGVDDTWTRRARVDLAVSGRDERRPLLALAHDPVLFPELARRGAALVLAGHTHGGQIAVPFLSLRLNLSRLAHRYHSGLVREGGATLYVHPGLGTTGPPLRLGVPPEITVLRLRRA